MFLLFIFTIGQLAWAEGSLKLPSYDGIIRGEVSTDGVATDQATFKIAGCTAVLIGEKIALTASHCKPKVGGAAKITVGHRDNSGTCNNDGSYIEKVAFPPDLAKLPLSGLPNRDLALIELKDRLCNSQPARVRRSLAPVGETVIAAGFGKGLQNVFAPDTLRMEVIATDYESLKEKLNLPQPSEEESNALRVYEVEVGKYFHVALPVVAGSTICFGDSGGPVFNYIDNQMAIDLVGISSGVGRFGERGVSECSGAFFQVFTALEPNMSWIEQQAAEWGHELAK